MDSDYLHLLNSHIFQTLTYSLCVFSAKAITPDKTNTLAGHINTIGKDVASEMKPMMVGPIKNPAIEITPIRAIATDAGMSDRLHLNLS